MLLGMSHGMDPICHHLLPAVAWTCLVILAQGHRVFLRVRWACPAWLKATHGGASYTCSQTLAPLRTL